MRCPCGEEITAARLKAVPHATRCVPCQERAERQARPKRIIPPSAIVMPGEVSLEDVLNGG
jgi:hypothetical protein